MCLTTESRPPKPFRNRSACETNSTRCSTRPNQPGFFVESSFRVRPSPSIRSQSREITLCNAMEAQVTAGRKAKRGEEPSNEFEHQRVL